jgi:predicted MFS family arabinose efflux permease
MGTVSTSLTVEQVPQHVGEMMSAHSAAINMGSMLASVIGGLMIASFGYSFFGFLMGLLGVVGAFTVQLLSVDPTMVQKS